MQVANVPLVLGIPVPDEIFDYLLLLFLLYYSQA